MIFTNHSHAVHLQKARLAPKLTMKTVQAGGGEVMEDPRGRELYRLWLGRNCNFINNYIPVLMLATNSNMDFQATTTKFGVIEYMTKYMTKSGQGNLLTVMEHSFLNALREP